MKEILLTSSVLILALMLLRLLFRKTISRQVQYALRKAEGGSGEAAA